MSPPLKKQVSYFIVTGIEFVIKMKFQWMATAIEKDELFPSELRFSQHLGHKALAVSNCSTVLHIKISANQWRLKIVLDLFSSIVRDNRKKIM